VLISKNSPLNPLRFSGDTKSLLSLEHPCVEKDQEFLDIYMKRPDPKKRGTFLEDNLIQWVKNSDLTHGSNRKNLLILGESASGKTMLLRYITKQLKKEKIPTETVNACDWQETEKFARDHAGKTCVLIAEELGLAFLTDEIKNKDNKSLKPVEFITHLKSINPKLCIIGDMTRSVYHDPHNLDYLKTLNNVFPPTQHIYLPDFKKGEIIQRLAKTFKYYGFYGLTTKMQKRLAHKINRLPSEPMRHYIRTMVQEVRDYWKETRKRERLPEDETRRPEVIPASVFAKVFKDVEVPVEV